MYPESNKKIAAIPDIAEDLPFVSIIIPFEPKMRMKAGFDYIINTAAEKSERELLKTYPENMTAPVIKKMHHALMRVNYSSHHNKSIGIFISPSIEKVCYFTHSTLLDDRNNRKAV